MSLSYEKRQKKWIKENDIKIGDPVRLIRATHDGEGEGPNVWPREAGGQVGNILKVMDISEWNIACYNPDADEWFGFPYFVLEKVEGEEKEMKKSYEERQVEWVKENDVKIGDMVRVIREAKDGEDGWCTKWAGNGTGWAGKVLRVKEIRKRGGVDCYNYEEDDEWAFPYFVLEKIMERKDKEWAVSYGLKVKTGDPVLVRDGEDENWRYALFSDVLSGDNDGFRYRTCGLSYHRCIPYVGNEHLVGTKMDYKAPEEHTKPKFVFGAKVKTTLSCGDEMEGVLIGFDEEDDDTPFEVAVRDEDAERGRIRYWVKSVTYID